MHLASPTYQQRGGYVYYKLQSASRIATPTGKTTLNTINLQHRKFFFELSAFKSRLKNIQKYSVILQPRLSGSLHGVIILAYAEIST